MSLVRGRMKWQLMMYNFLLFIAKLSNLNYMQITKRVRAKKQQQLPVHIELIGE